MRLLGIGAVLALLTMGGSHAAVQEMMSPPTGTIANCNPEIQRC